jgi:hypothetical protein
MGGSVAKQLPASNHIATSPKALLPALAKPHAAESHFGQTGQRKRVLRGPVIFIFSERWNAQETLGICCYILPAYQRMALAQ